MKSWWGYYTKSYEPISGMPKGNRITKSKFEIRTLKAEK
jgi:hypothetical protein